MCKFEVESDGLAGKIVSGAPADVVYIDAYARAWSPVGSMLEDGARHRAPMTGSSVTEQCERSDEDVLISGDGGRADAIHGGRQEAMRRTYARNEDVWTCCCCDDPRRGRSESWSRFGSDEPRAPACANDVSARLLLSRCLLPLPPCRCITWQPSILHLAFFPFFFHPPHLYAMSKRVRRDSESDEQYTSPFHDLLAHSAQPPTKYTTLDAPTSTTAKTAITCVLPPHLPIKFDTYNEYETHYHQSHDFRCLDCAKNFPTDHFLSLHIAETHDPLSRIKRERGEKTYHCFVQDCEKVCSTPQKRRRHLLDKHMFPRNYDFHIVNHGSDNRTSLLRPEAKTHQKQNNARRHKSLAQEDITEENMHASEVMDIEEKNVDNLGQSPKDKSMDDIADSMAALKFVPKSVSFGRSRQRGGLSKS